MFEGERTAQLRRKKKSNAF